MTAKIEICFKTIIDLMIYYFPFCFTHSETPSNTNYSMLRAIVLWKHTELLIKGIIL